MNQKSFEMSPAARRRLDDYLDEVERLLKASGVERQQRRSIVDDVEAQALEMLQERTAQAEEADVRAVLAKLDAPEEYARAFAEGASEPDEQPAGAPPPEPASPAPASTNAAAPAASPRLSPYALAGALMLLPVLFIGPLTFGGGLLFFGPWAGMFGVPILSPWSLIGQLPFLILMCILGILAISQIRQSEGRFFGMGLVVFDALLLPLLLLNSALLTILRLGAFYSFWPEGQVGLVPISRLALLLCMLALDCVIGLSVWKRLSEPSPVGQPRGQFLRSNINIP